MSRPVVSDNAIRLIERWMSPHAWHNLIREHNDLMRTRENIRDTAEAALKLAGYTPPRPMGDDADPPEEQKRKYAILRAVQADPILTALRQQEADTERRYVALLNELGEIEAEVAKCAVDLYGHLPGPVNCESPNVDEAVRGLRTLYGLLLHRRREGGQSTAAEGQQPSQSRPPIGITDPPAIAGGRPTPPMPASPYLSPRELTKALGLPGDREGAVAASLRRLYHRIDGCRMPVTDPRRGEPRYAYRVPSVWPHLIDKLPGWQ